MRIRLTGDVGVELDSGRRHALPGRQGALVLAYLTLHRHRVVSREELADAVWGEARPGAWLGALSALVSKLRAGFGKEVIARVGSGYQLRLPPEATVDIDDASVAAARSTFLPGEEYRWVQQVREERRGQLLRALVSAGDVTSAAEAIELDPFHEPAHRRLIEALAATGDRAGALRAYERCRRLLADELGIDPDPQTQQIYLRLLRGSPDPPARQLPLPPALDRSLTVVGRRSELARLMTVFTALRRPRLVTVTGEPGIGKTTVISAFAAAVHQAGATVLLGGCDEEIGAAYRPVVDALSPVVATPEGTLRGLGRDAGELVRLWPRLAEDLPGLPPPTRGEADLERFRLFSALSGVLAGLAAARPVVLVLEDMHWADRPSLLLTRHLMRSTGQVPLLVVASARSSELSREHPFTAAVADLRRDDLVSTIELTGLDGDAIAELVAIRLGEPSLAPSIAQATGGNPLFVRELVRDLAETGERQLRVPASVAELIGRRLVRLPPPTPDVLRAAAVLGAEFELTPLADVLAMDAEVVVTAAETAGHAGLVAEVAGMPDRWRFSHVLIRDTVYGELSTSRRRRLHAQAGAVLERLGAEPAELAHHVIAAGDAAQALVFSRQAGAAALARLAYEDAAAHVERAIEAQDRLAVTDLGQRTELLVDLGDARRKAGDARATAAYRSAAEAARTSGDAAALATAALGLTDVWARNAVADPGRIGMLEEALNRLGNGWPALRARCLARLADELYYQDGSGPRRSALTAEAVQLARQLHDPAALAAALHAQTYAEWAPGADRQRLASGQEIVRLASLGRSPERVLDGHAWCQIAALELGELAVLDQALEDYRNVAEQLRQPRYLWYSDTRRAMRALLAGEIANGERIARAAMEAGLRINEPDAVPVYTGQMQLLAMEAPAPRTLTEYERSAAEEDRGLPPDSIPCLYNRAGRIALAVEVGDLHRARQLWAGWPLPDLDQLPPDPMGWAPILALLTRGASLLPDGPDPAVLYRLLAPLAAANIPCGSVGYYGSVSLYLGMLATRLERFTDAERHFATAAAMHTRMRAPTWLARTHREHARMLNGHPSPL